MKFNLKYCVLFVFIFFSSTVANSDVLYFFDYDKFEYIVGEKKAKLLVGYTKNRKYSDKRSRLTSSFMKKWFGKEQELRYTTVYLLDKDLIRQVDYGKEKILETTFSKLTDPDLDSKIKKSRIPEAVEIINERYVVKKPVMSVKEISTSGTVGNYPVKHVQITLGMETFDKKKNAISRTEVVMNLYLTSKIEGYDEYNNFIRHFGKRLGVDSYKFGNLERLSQFLERPLKAAEAKKTEGFPVKTTLVVKGMYITKPNTSSEKRVERVLQKLTIDLKKVTKGPFDLKLFEPPEKWVVKSN
ncbi:MAG: hypothetical protein GY760_15135 [Deltaproteobacteria bacterium]|nr:hypothetical protein [Deltaproteobacteria bacterium]